MDPELAKNQTWWVYMDVDLAKNWTRHVYMDLNLGASLGFFYKVRVIGLGKG
jgi:hypothetical protein